MGLTELIFDIRRIICNENVSVEPPYSPIPEYFIFLCKLVLYIETIQKAIITIIKYTLKRLMSHIEVIPYCLFTCSLVENKQCHHCCRYAVIRYIQISGVLYTEKFVVTSEPYKYSIISQILLI